eukprot:gnl/MRDRNA2_/MRDRNA2_55849_c0_seq1.p1 gnl/MRDRNA2_/MRDRNA2_55849_c0~~gnl/MRDRNA2_/MRDRNA2_55849_c0_seq1.p1  ORF type:complete len:902 (+),score=211.92 gnl/MRDRNA2_/MRDRNA2_55849_c0_seq1:78-2783(+)
MAPPSAFNITASRESEHRLRERVSSIERHEASHEAAASPLIQQMAHEVVGEAKDILGSINFLKASNELTRKHTSSFQERFVEPRKRMKDLENLRAEAEAAFKDLESEAHVNLEKIQDTMTAVEYENARVREEARARSCQLQDLRNKLSQNRRDAARADAQREQGMDEDQREIRQCEALIEHEERELEQLRREACQPSPETMMLREHLAMVRADRMAHHIEQQTRADERRSEIRNRLMPQARQRAAIRQDYVHELQWFSTQTSSCKKSPSGTGRELGQLFGAISPAAQGAASMLKAAQPQSCGPTTGSKIVKGYAEIWKSAAESDLAASVEHYDRLVCKLQSAAAQAKGPQKLELKAALDKFEASPLSYLAPLSAAPGTRAHGSSSHQKSSLDNSTQGTLAEFFQDASRICEDFGVALGFQVARASPAPVPRNNLPSLVISASQSSKRKVEKVVVPTLDLSQVTREILEEEDAPQTETQPKEGINSDLLAACASKLAASAASAEVLPSGSLGSSKDRTKKEISNKTSSAVNQSTAADRDDVISWPKASDAFAASASEIKNIGHSNEGGSRGSWPNMLDGADSFERSDAVNDVIAKGTNEGLQWPSMSDPNAPDITKVGAHPKKDGVAMDQHIASWPEMHYALASDAPWPATSEASQKVKTESNNKSKSKSQMSDTEGGFGEDPATWPAFTQKAGDVQKDAGPLSWPSQSKHTFKEEGSQSNGEDAGFTQMSLANGGFGADPEDWPAFTQEAGSVQKDATPLSWPSQDEKEIKEQSVGPDAGFGSWPSVPKLLADSKKETLDSQKEGTFDAWPSSAAWPDDCDEAPSKKVNRDLSSKGATEKRTNDSKSVSAKKNAQTQVVVDDEEADIDAVSKRLVEAKKKIEGVERDFMVLLDDLTRSAAL